MTKSLARPAPGSGPTSSATASPERLATLVASGFVAQAEAAARQALVTGSSSPSVRAELQLVLGTCTFLTGRHAETLELTEQVLHCRAASPSLVGRAHAARLQAFMASGDDAAARRELERILGGAVRGDAPGNLAAALIALGVMAWDGGRATEALVHVRAAVVRSRRSDRRLAYDQPELLLVAMHTSLGEFEEAHRHLHRAHLAASRWRDATLASWCDVHAARLAWMTGSVADARRLALTAQDFASRAVVTHYDALTAAVLASTACAVGDTGEARRMANAIRDPTPELGALGWSARMWMEADVAEAQSGPSLALAVLGPALTRPVWRNRLLLERPHGAAWWVRNALAAGETHTASIILLSVEQLESANPSARSIVGSCAHARGVYGGDMATLDRAVELYTSPWAQAAAQEDAAALAVRSRKGDSRQWLDRAHETYVACGGKTAAARVQRRMRELPSPVRRVTAEATAPFAWRSLSEPEQRVAFTVAQGLTNMQAAEELCLSRYTVDFHLRQIFRKLGISSRVELARLVAIEESAFVNLVGPTAGAPWAPANRPSYRADRRRLPAAGACQGKGRSLR